MSQLSEVWEARATTLHERACEVTEEAEKIVDADDYPKPAIFDVVNRASIALLASELADADDVDKETALSLIIGELFSYIEQQDPDIARLADLTYDEDEMEAEDIVLHWDADEDPNA